MSRAQEAPAVAGPAAATDWRLRAACRHWADPDLFFPLSDGGRSLGQIAQAKAVCAACPVAAQCLGFARRTRQQYGIWGGLTAAERGPGAASPASAKPGTVRTKRF